MTGQLSSRADTGMARGQFKMVNFESGGELANTKLPWGKLWGDFTMALAPLGFGF